MGKLKAAKYKIIEEDNEPEIILHYIDRWCARNVRKVGSCDECLHFAECEKAGHSLSPRAIEHRESKKGQ